MKKCNSCYTMDRDIACFCKECGFAFSDVTDPDLREVIGKEAIVSQLLAIVAD